MVPLALARDAFSPLFLPAECQKKKRVILVSGICHKGNTNGKTLGKREGAPIFKHDLHADKEARACRHEEQSTCARSNKEKNHQFSARRRTSSPLRDSRAAVFEPNEASSSARETHLADRRA